MAEEQLATRRLVALQYYARLPPRVAQFQWPSPASLLGIQEHLVNDLYLDRDRLDGIDYKLSFLKHLFTLLQTAVDQVGDGSEAEISGELLEVYAGLLAFPRSKIASTTQQVKYYYPASGDDSLLEAKGGIFDGWHCITVEEEIYAISKGTTGLKTWEASLRLAAHLVARPEILARKDIVILELGSGSGFLGAVLAKQAEQAHFHLTDRDGIVLEYLQRTIDKNATDSSHVHVAPLDWLEVQEGGTDDSSLYLSSLRPNLILAADTIYDPRLLDSFCQVIKTALSESWADDSSNEGIGSEQPYALMATCVRNETTHSLFLEAAARYGMAVRVEPLQAPKLDLYTSKLSSAGQIHLFGSGGGILLASFKHASGTTLLESRAICGLSFDLHRGNTEWLAGCEWYRIGRTGTLPRQGWQNV